MNNIKLVTEVICDISAYVASHIILFLMMIIIILTLIASKVISFINCNEIEDYELGMDADVSHVFDDKKEYKNAE